MHEMSVALEVCRIAEQRLGLEALPSLRAVCLEVGDDAGVELSSLSFCLETLLGAPPFAGAKPLIERRAGDVLRVSYLEVDDGRPDD
jgi:Zn finger protein HypA/HybF involved in hydrogenase expression